jgi:hypothetical protein
MASAHMENGEDTLSCNKIHWDRIYDIALSW